MGNSSSNVNKMTQEFYNNILQDSSTICDQNCDQKESGNVVVGIGVDADAVGISQKCNVDAQCVLTNELSNIIQNTATAQASQSNDTTQSMVSFTFSNVKNSNQINQGYNNYITQMMTASCQANANEIQSNNIVFVKNSNVGVIGLSQDANLVTNCYLNNLAKSTTQNTAAATVDQTNKIRSAFAMIVVSIAAILIIGGIIVVLVLFVPSLGAGGGGGGGEGKDGKKKDPDLNTLATLALL